MAVHFAGWLGRDALHAGAFVAAGGAWAVSGNAGGGKSTLLAELAVRGHAVLSDDMLVIEELEAHAGPRCIDLRPDPERPHLAAQLEPSRAGSRLRLTLPAVDARLPLRGIVYLEWGQDHAVTPLGAEQRLGRVLAASAPGLRGDPARALDLATIPAWEVRRPRDWQCLASTLEALVRISGASDDRR